MTQAALLAGRPWLPLTITAGAWTVTLGALLSGWPDSLWLVRVAVVVASAVTYVSLAAERQAALAVSPLPFLGVIAALAFSVIPAALLLLGMEPDGIYSARLLIYADSTGERIVLQFAASCLTVTSLLHRHRYDKPASTPSAIRPAAVALFAAVSGALAIGYVSAGVSTAADRGFLASNILDATPPILCLLVAVLTVQSVGGRWKYGLAAIAAIAVTAVTLMTRGNIKTVALLGVVCGAYIAFSRATWRGMAMIVLVLSLGTALMVTGLNLTKRGYDKSYSELAFSSLKYKFAFRQIESGYCLQNVVLRHENDSATAAGAARLFAGLVPRLLWPEKPNMSPGSDHAVQYCGYRKEFLIESEHSASVTLLGDPLVLAGPLGLVVAQATLLVGLAAFTVLALRHGSRGTAVLLALSPWLIDFDQHFPLYLALVAKHLLYLTPFIILLILHRRWPWQLKR